MSESAWKKLTIVSSVAMAGFSTVHLIDDFLFQVPQEFNLTVPFTQVLSLAYMIGLVGLIASSAGGSKDGYLGLSIAGILIALTQLAKSVPEMLLLHPWRSGLVSQVLAIGLLVASTSTSLAAFRVWRLGSMRGGTSAAK
jgi:hypothetical protein